MGSESRLLGNRSLIVAVSGGVDSVVLLDYLARQSSLRLIVAHFDHGIRPDSADDAQFVATLAKRYGLQFETRREELGPHASEALARERRYAFLQSVAKQHEALIATAHHADDVIETIAINLSRGTGWRGLAVLDSSIIRPFLSIFKEELKKYAAKHALQWREDSTNMDTTYLRNKLRIQLKNLSKEKKMELLALRREQVRLKNAIDHETLFIQGRALERYFFTNIDSMVADELLRARCLTVVQAAPTRPQRARALLAIKTAKPGSRYHVMKGLDLRVEKRVVRLIPTAG